MADTRRRYNDAKQKPKRNYKKEYETYHSKPEQRKRRSQRNMARRKAIENGTAKKGDGKDVHHKDKNTANNSSGNLAVVSKSKNRADNRGKGGRPRKRK